MTLDELAAAIVMVEPDDLQELAGIHATLQELAKSTTIPSEAARAANAAFALVEKVILRECEDPAAAIASVGGTISAVQAACEGRPAPLPEDTPAGASGGQDGQEPAEKPKDSASPAVEAPASSESMAMDASLLSDFITESADHLEKAEGALLDLEANPDNGEHVNGIFRAFHTIKGTSGFLALDKINRLAHKAETLLDRARKGEIRLEGSRADLALDAVDMLKRLIEGLRARLDGQVEEEQEGYDELLARLDSPDSEPDQSPESLRVGDVLVAKGRADRQEIEKVASQPADEAIGKRLVKAGVAKAKDVVDALRTQKQMGGGSAATAADASLRVSMKRLDKLIDMVGELVIAQSMMVQDETVRGADSQVLTRKVGQVSKITRELHDLTLSMRMVPLKSTFQKMERLVRDLARKSGKDVRFVSMGEDTEIDRNMVEAIGDPLVHMMRNSVDHGVEPPEDRVAAGKPRQGTVTLRAYHAAGSVVIEVIDDGQGIDPERIVAKAVERGIIDPGKELSKQEILDIIFLPGFSTARTITDVSGRGVGMDVVRKNVESMRGRVEIASEKGDGSQFTIKLPLTLAIIDGMLIKVGSESYILPTLTIKHAFRPERSAISTVGGKGEMVMLRGQLIPVFRLYELFGVPGAKEDPTEGLLVVVEHEGQKAALLADALLGQQQVVIKSVGTALGEVEGVSGAAIVGDGRVGLILDVAGLMRVAHRTGDNREPEPASLGNER